MLWWLRGVFFNALQVHDPYTLVVALDAAGNAEGDLYLDDFHTFDYEKSNAFVHRQFTLKQFDGTKSILVSTDASKGVANAAAFQPTNTVERVVVMGVKQAPHKVTLTR